MKSPSEIRNARLIVNPNAGNGKVSKHLSGIVSALHAAGLDVQVTETIAPGHATTLVQSFNGLPSVVIAVGGDGTVNEIVNGLAHPESVLAVIPTGTGNDFARLIGVPDIPRALEGVQRGYVETFDTAMLRIVAADGEVTERAFINTMGVGFDAAVAVRVSKVSLGRGIIPYLIAVLSTLRRFTAVPATLIWDGVTLDADLFLATIGNGTTSGGGFMLTPAACPDDGLLDLCLVKDVRIRRVLRILPKTFQGGHVHEKEVLVARAASFRIDLAQPLAIHADGEIVSRTAVRVEVRVCPRSIQLLTLRNVHP